MWICFLGLLLQGVGQSFIFLYRLAVVCLPIQSLKDSQTTSWKGSLRSQNSRAFLALNLSQGSGWLVQGLAVKAGD